MPYIEWTSDMGEISGFGGSYEEACRLMVKAGIDYWELQDAAFKRGEREKFDPHYQGYKNIYGIISDTNDDAKNLDKAVMDARIIIDDKEVTVGEYGATGAMHQASISHIFAFRNLGAEEYCRQLREREQNENI